MVNHSSLINLHAIYSTLSNQIIRVLLFRFFFFLSRLCYYQAAEHLQSFIADCDRRTELAKKRLAETQDEISAEVSAKVKKKKKLFFFLGK